MKFISVVVMMVVVGCASKSTPVERQMIGLIEKFDRWDYDGSARLSKDELKEAEELSGYTADEIVAFYDRNRDKKISLWEAQKGIERLKDAEKIAEDRGR